MCVCVAERNGDAVGASEWEAAIGMRALNEVEVLTDGGISLSVGPGLTAAWIGMLGASLCFTALVLHGARRLMRRLLIQEFGLD